jgi:hypothetical protein
VELEVGELVGSLAARGRKLFGRHLFRRNAVVLKDSVSLGLATVPADSSNEVVPVEVVANVIDVGQAHGLAAIGADFDAAVHRSPLTE